MTGISPDLTGVNLAPPNLNNAPITAYSNVGSDGYDYTGISSGSVDSAINSSQSGGWLNWLKNSIGDITNVGASAATIAGALSNADDTRNLGNYIQNYLETLGGQLNTDAQFQGYGVTSGLGNGSVGYNDQGQLQVDLGLTNPQYAKAQNAADAAYGAAQNFATQAGIPVGQRQDDIYASIMATQNPELDRMQAEQQAQEYARGRGGIRGSQYGGTAEDAAMARARAMASNDAAFRAREMANNERGMLGQLAGQFGQYGNQSLQASYLPMQQQIAAMQLGMKNADMAQTGQLQGLDYLSQLMLGGTNANVNAQHSANQLTGNLYNALLSNLGGVAGSDGSSGSGLLGAIGGLMGGDDGFLDMLFGDG